MRSCWCGAEHFSGFSGRRAPHNHDKLPCVSTALWGPSRTPTAGCVGSCRSTPISRPAPRLISKRSPSACTRPAEVFRLPNRGGSLRKPRSCPAKPNFEVAQKADRADRPRDRFWRLSSRRRNGRVCASESSQLVRRTRCFCGKRATADGEKHRFRSVTSASRPLPAPTDRPRVCQR